MKALILAAGRGSRMGDETKQKPKCLTELAGKPLLQWQMDALKAAGITEISLVVGYQKESLSTYPHFYNSHWDQTNMVESLYCARALLRKEPCIISYSDIVYHPAIVKMLVDSPHDIAVAYDELWHLLWEKRFENPLVDAETFALKKGRIVTIGGKASQINEIQGQYMGLLKMTPSFWEGVEKELTSERREKWDMTALLNHLIGKGESLWAVPTSGKWCEVDSQKDQQLYENLLKKDYWTHDFR